MFRRVTFATALVFGWAMMWASPAAADSGGCQGRWFWSYTIELPLGFWSSGPHSYQMQAAINGVVNFTPGPIGFGVTSSAPIYEGQVRLRFFALQALSNGSIVAPTQINPGQDTIFQVQDDLIGTKQQADAFAASESEQFRWDGGPWVEAPRGPVLSFCARHPLSTGLWEREWGRPY